MNLSVRHLVTALAIACAASACSQPAEPPAPVAPTEPSAPVVPPPPAVPETPQAVTATATLAATEGNTAAGTLTLVAASDGVHITGTITGVAAAGSHGFHIHETGDCSAPDATSAGPHFNPHGHAHGHPGEGEHHVGDMLNLTADADGVLHVDALAQAASLGDGGDGDVLGRAIILHAAPDDYHSQPAGDAGARIACGVIER